MLCLIPMAWVSFRFLNLTEGLTGGLIENIDEALDAAVPGLGIILGAFIGLALIFLFPIHWCIFYRPEDIGLIIAVTVPWILCCVIISGIFAHSPKGAMNSSFAIGIGYLIILTIPYLVLALIVPKGAAILDGLLAGLSDLPYLLAVFTAILEGCLVGAVFGGFIGSLKYKPGGSKAKLKRKAKPTEISDVNKAIESAAVMDEMTCSNCGAKLVSDDLFCTNCGAKR